MPGYSFVESLRPYEPVEVSAPGYYTVTTSTGPRLEINAPTHQYVYVGLNHQWPYEVGWGELEAGRVLDDGDIIRAVITPNAVSPDVVVFTLWSDRWYWKEINVPDGETGSSWNIHTGKTWFGAQQYEDSVGLWAHQVRNGQLLSFRKAKTAGLVSTTYLLRRLELLHPGTRVTFRWERDWPS